MQYETLDIIAPGLIRQSWSEPEVLSAAVWLWMHSKSHRDLPLHTLSPMLVPAIKHRQFVLASQAGQAVGFISWANFSADAEQRYLTQIPLCMPDHDWNCGERMWLLDWVAPFGHNMVMRRLTERVLFTNRCVRALYRRGDEMALKVKTFHGIAVLPEEATFWFEQHSVAWPSAGARVSATPSVPNFSAQPI